MLASTSGAVKLEVDSLRRPELVTFPIRLKLTNYTRHKVVLVFDSLPDGHYQAKNLCLVAGQDTFYLGVKGPDHHLVFSANTVTSFIGVGYFLRGKGHFDSFRQIDSVFKYGRLVYEFAPSVFRDVDLSGTALSNDTLLLPTKLETCTVQAIVANDFFSASYGWREKRLNQ
ncbi:hypothetical protein [Hymenobacter canadensis]|uniref:Uncharacterized protein n=1 Tax=Hymenobacter canadensis TaxID=2999067 RepID=A0ABY7LVD4_9BACT|nr:hypothetical protein [Hymenobacter canadensis]WBA44006.1 hypothetical protein O3303_20795 [Hymenobacter canadensis]